MATRQADPSTQLQQSFSKPPSSIDSLPLVQTSLLHSRQSVIHEHTLSEQSDRQQSIPLADTSIITLSRIVTRTVSACFMADYQQQLVRQFRNNCLYPYLTSVTTFPLSVLRWTLEEWSHEYQQLISTWYKLYSSIMYTEFVPKMVKKSELAM